ncbi:MAG: sugar phosphate isomerase/epimerase family protein [Planctomycetota bacterium]
MSLGPVGVFASIDAGLGVDWSVIKELGVPTIQLHAPHPDHRDKASAKALAEQLGEISVTCTAVFGGFEGESYADIPTVAQTIGLVPAETRSSRLAEMKAISDFASWLSVDAVALHLGFIDHRVENTYAEVVAATRDLCRYVAAHDQYLHLETGQETAEGLLMFIDAVSEPNLRINFDPANMILYGTGDPIEALRTVAVHVRSVHCKDATWSDQPGVTWGAEVPLGSGSVDVERYLKTLIEIGYAGPLTIEREIPDDPSRQKAEIESAIDLLNRCRQTLQAW